MADIEVVGPDGRTIHFDEGTSKDDIAKAMRKLYPQTEVSRVPGKVVQGALPHAVGALIGAPFGPGGVLLGSLAPTVADLASRGYNAAMSRINPDWQITPTMDYIRSGIEKLPMYDAPRNIMERSALAAGEAVGGAGPQVAALRALSSTARSPAARELAEALSRGPRTQMAIAPVAGATSQAVTETTGSPVAGTVASLIAGGGMGYLARPKAARITTSEEIAQRSRNFYDSSDAMNTFIKPENINRLIQDVKIALKEAGGANNKERAQAIHPKTQAWVDGLEEAAEATSLQDLEYSRRQLSAVLTQGDSDGTMARAAMDKFDDVIDKWTDASLTQGKRSSIDALEKARKLWKDKYRLEAVEEIIRQSDIRKDVNYSQAGYEQAVRRGFANIALDPKKLKKFSPDQQKFITGIAKGGPVQNALRWLGRWKPSGVISTGHGAAVGGGAAYALGFGPEMVAASALAPGVVGGAARAGATAMQNARVNALKRRVDQGGPPPARPRATTAGITRGLLSDAQLAGPGL